MLSLVSISAYNVTAPSGDSTYIYGNIGDEFAVNVSFKLNYVQYFDGASPLILSPDNTLVNATDAEYYMYSEQGGFLKYFKGQQLKLVYYNAGVNATSTTPFIVTEIIDDNTIKTNNQWADLNISGNQSFLYSDDIPDIVELQAGFDGYSSLVTGNAETYTFINGIGKSNAELFDVRNITSTTTFDTTTKNIFIDFVINDRIGTYLYEDDIPLEYFVNIKAYNGTDTNNNLSLSTSINCKIGGFDKHYDTNDSIPTVTDFRVKNLAGDIIEGIDLANENVIEIDVDNTSQDYQVIFCVVNDNYTEDLTITQDESMLFDRVSQTIMYGTEGKYGYTVFTTYLSITGSTITANIWLDSESVAFIKDNGLTDYRIFIKPLSTTFNSNILASEGQFIEVLPTLNVFSSLCKFGLEPTPNVDYHYANPDLFETDIVIAVNQLTYDFSTFDIDIKSVTNSIKASNGTDTIILDTNYQDVNNYGFDSNGVKQINQNVQLGLREELEHRQLVVRRLEEVGTTTTLLINYPFIVGFESNEAITDQDVPSDVYTFSEVGDGLTKNWYKYASLGYTFNYVTKVIFEFNGGSYQQEIIVPITINNYESNVNWYDNTIKAFKGVTELLDSGNKYVNDNCIVRCEVYNDDTPAIEDIEAYIYIVPTGSNRTKAERVSTDLGGNQFTKITALSKSRVLNKYTFEFQFNHTVEDVDIYCRILEKASTIEYLCPILWEDDTILNAEGNTDYIQEEGCVAVVDARITETGELRITQLGDIRIVI